jgi:hypothetical protein
MPKLTDLMKANTTAANAPSGPYKFITKVAASNSSTIDCGNVFGASDGFSTYRIILDNLATASNSSYTWLRYAVGGTVVSDSFYGWSMVRHEGSGSLSSNYEAIDTKWRIYNNDHTTGLNGFIDFGNTASGLRQQINFHVASGSSTRRGGFSFGGGGSDNTDEVSGFHIISSAPNFTGGTVRIYGVYDA